MSAGARGRSKSGRPFVFNGFFCVWLPWKFELHPQPAGWDCRQASPFLIMIAVTDRRDGWVEPSS
jgi:hypothetical protein